PGFGCATCPAWHRPCGCCMPDASWRLWRCWSRTAPAGSCSCCARSLWSKGAAAVESLTAYIKEAKRETRRARQEPPTQDSLIRRHLALPVVLATEIARKANLDRKSTRLNSSHVKISYAVFCLKKKINIQII